MRGVCPDGFLVIFCGGFGDIERTRVANVQRREANWESLSQAVRDRTQSSDRKNLLAIRSAVIIEKEGHPSRADTLPLPCVQIIRRFSLLWDQYSTNERGILCKWGQLWGQLKSTHSFYRLYMNELQR